jgi:hypothetical protein
MTGLCCSLPLTDTQPAQRLTLPYKPPLSPRPSFQVLLRFRVTIDPLPSNSRTCNPACYLVDDLLLHLVLPPSTVTDIAPTHTPA